MRVFPISVARRFVRLVAVSLVAAPLSALSAQGTIRGKVVEVGTERPIADVQVKVTGTTSGAVTNSQGDFVIAAVPAGQREVVARRLGYTKQSQSVTVSTGGDVRANFTMTPAASELEAIVVSGTAGTAEKRQIGNAVTQAEAAFGPIGVLVNNAGGVTAPTLASTDEAAWLADLDLNLNGAWRCVRAVQDGMMARRKGIIINISSANATGIYGYPAYSAAKAGLEHFTRFLAVELGRYGVRANAIAPGSVKTQAWNERVAHERVLEKAYAAMHQKAVKDPFKE